MAASKVLVWEDPRYIDKAGHLIFPDGQNRGRGAGALDVGQFDREEEVLWPDGCAAMYRKEMLDQIGGFDEDFLLTATMPSSACALVWPGGLASIRLPPWSATIEARRWEKILHGGWS